jgi:hypothetical protein
MAQTHQVTVEGEVVRKTYVSWSRDEHLREWAALQAISSRAPGLAPTPYSLSPGPSLSMSLVPGEPLSGRLTRPQLAALSQALDRLWSLPVDGIQPLLLPALIERTRTAALAHTDGGDVVADAHRAVAGWLAGPEVDSLFEAASPVIGHGDPNLSNYLWDGSTVRIIDFEDSGVSDLAVELANLVEHLSSRETDWTGFLEPFPVDEQRLLTARRLWSSFWLTLISPGGPSAGRNPPSIVMDQAERVLRLLGRDR